MEKTHKFYLAPLRGITDRVFRTVYERHFGRFDRMLAPFIPTIRGERVKDYHIRDVLPGSDDNSYNDVSRLVPQIIGHDVNGFLLLSKKFADLGFTSVNWNLGCPAPLIVKKQRGCGLLPHRDVIEKFLAEVIPNLSIPLSVKVRLGLDNKDELEMLMPIFNDYPLHEIIIHPRTGSQMYNGIVDLDSFEKCMLKSCHPIVFNGDITNARVFKLLVERFPGVNRWMIGRGIVKDPNLLNMLKNCANSDNNDDTVMAMIGDVSAVYRFLDDLLYSCKGKRREQAVLGRMKEIWRYLCMGVADMEEIGELREKVIRCETIAEYQAAIGGKR